MTDTDPLPDATRPRLPRFLRRPIVALRGAWRRFESAIFLRARYSEPKMVAMGALGIIGFPLYYLMWAKWLPQPYENLPLRILGSSLFVPLYLVHRWPRRALTWLPLYWYLAMTFALPFFFTYMLLQNGANTVWLLSHLCSVFLLVMLFDLSAFLITTTLGSLVAVGLYLLTPHLPLARDAVLAYLPVWGFAVAAGSTFSFSQSISQQSRIDALIAASNNIAHELRTPLASVRIASQAVQRFLPALVASHRAAVDARLPVADLRESHLSKLSRALDTVDLEVQHANTVIDMLLMAAKPIGEVKLEALSARSCLEEAMERYPFGSQHERDRVAAEVTGDFQFLGSRILVVHVLFNLIKNALFHTGRAGKGDIRLSVHADEGGNRILCADTGPGIPAEVLPHIFERFYSSATDYSTGLGVGLSFVRSALERIHASIHCRSRYGEFTEFALVFPTVAAAGRRVMLSTSGDIQPFRFPTTTVLVDDHEEYLEVVPLMLDPMLHLKSYSSPRAALAALGNAGSRPVPGGGWLYRWKDRPSQSQELIALDIDSIHRIVYDPERFSEVSVIVVDYFMPEMDGVSFCRRLNNPYIGKVLLTGRAEDSVAIEAFNSGVIDRFIRKSDPQAMPKLEIAIRELQQRYFDRAGAFVAETLAMGGFGFLRDPAFRAVFEKLVAQTQPVESYVFCNPTGLLLVDAWGAGRFVLVQTEEDLRAQVEVAEERGAPDSVLRPLKTAEALPWFWSSGGYYSPQLAEPETSLFPATAVQGERWYYYSVIDNVDPFRLRQVKSYRTWLREQDARAASAGR